MESLRKEVISMRYRKGVLVGALILVTGHAAWAGGSNYGITPGAKTSIEGKISEWPVPTPRFARDPAPGNDGNIYIAVMSGNKIARFDPRSKAFIEWELPEGARPHGLLVDQGGQVWYTGNGNGTIGRLDPATGKTVEYRAPSGGDPHTLVIDGQGIIWFTVQRGNRIARLDTRTGKITEYPTTGRPYGIALDQVGNVWFCQISVGKLGKLDTKTGVITEFALDPDSQPRRMATAPDGFLWVTLYGKGALIRVDPRTGRVLKEYPLPGGRNGGPYAVTVDGAGAVWANEIHANTVVRLDPKTEQIRVFPLPSGDVGIRKMIVDAQGRLWYMGSHNGRLGVIE
jgi:virginiamycin B lyase